MKKPRGYTGTQKDDYTGTPGKFMDTPRPKPRPKGVAWGNALRKGRQGGRAGKIGSRG